MRFVKVMVSPKYKNVKKNCNIISDVSFINKHNTKIFYIYYI